MDNSRKRYCHIKSCINNVGTTDTLLYIPIGPRGDQWRENISKYITTYDVRTIRGLCRLHFDPKDIVRNQKNSGRWTVRPGAVPTTFIENRAVSIVGNSKSSSKIKEAEVRPIVKTAESTPIELSPEIGIVKPTYPRLTYKRRTNEMTAPGIGIQVKKTKPNIYRVESVEKLIQEVEDDTYSYNTISAIEDVLVQPEPQKCYICNSQSEIHSRNLYETKSKHTETRICDYILRWLAGDQPSREIFEQDDNCICVDCFDAINEYDLLRLKAEEIDKRLRHSFLLTDSLFKGAKEDKHQEKYMNLADEPKLFLDSSTREFTRSNEIIESEKNDQICIGPVTRFDSGNVEQDMTEPNTNFDKRSQPELVLDACTGNFVESCKRIEVEELRTTFDVFGDDSDGQTNDKGVRQIHYAFYCEICETTLDSPELLKKHEHPQSNFKVVAQRGTRKGPKPKSKTRIKIKEIQFADNEKADEKKYNDCSFIKCPCQIPEEEYEDHIKSHTPVIYTLKCIICCLKLKSETELNEHMALHVATTSNPLKCVLCEYVGRNKKYLYRHMHNHHEENISPCEICGELTHTRSKYAAHILYRHSPRVDCEKCGKSLANKYALRDHIREIHVNQALRKKYPCSICGKQFTSSANKRTHERTHDSNYTDKVHPCSLCERRFPRKHLLRKHMEKAHEVTELLGLTNSFCR